MANDNQQPAPKLLSEEQVDTSSSSTFRQWKMKNIMD